MEIATLKNKLNFNSREEYIEGLVIQQLKKDFFVNGIDLSCNSSKSLEDQQLVNEITAVIDRLLARDLEKLKVILYQIDVPVHSLFTEADNRVKPPDQIASMIIQRELLKVLTRLYFKEIH